MSRIQILSREEYKRRLADTYARSDHPVLGMRLAKFQFSYQQSFSTGVESCPRCRSVAVKRFLHSSGGDLSCRMCGFLCGFRQAKHRLNIEPYRFPAGLCYTLRGKKDTSSVFAVSGLSTLIRYIRKPAPPSIRALTITIPGTDGRWVPLCLKGEFTP